MKNIKNWLICAGFLIIANLVQAQSAELTPGYYVVVAAYAESREDYAKRYTEVLNTQGYKTQYGFNSSKNLYFVYTSYFSDLKSSLVELKEVRSKGAFSDAWVRVVSGNIVATEQTTKPKADQPVEVEKKAEEKKEQSAPTPIGPVEKPPVEAVTITETEEDVTEPEEKLIQYPVITLGNTEVFLSLYNAANNRVIDGEIQVIDTERTRFLKEVKGNEYMLLPDPKSKSGQLTLIAEVFGYRKLQQEINYPLPLADTVKPYVELMGTTVAVLFNMVRYHKGDIATLYHVFFFNDAAVMLPESKYELNNLLQMMQENKNYRIRLHGHTNGNYHGKILALGPEKNFFSMEGVTQMMGSAKDLSFKRAETIKEFLVTNNIDPSRIEIKSWGGKRPLYDKHSVNAKKNVRVEVEILQE